MGNKRKSDKWLPSDHLRVRAFVFALTSKMTDVEPGTEPKISTIQSELEKLSHPIEISSSALRNWLSGKDWPSKANVNWLKQAYSGCATWLESDIEISPLHRFLCALDIWGSSIDSPQRKFDVYLPKTVSVGHGLKVLVKRWAPAPVTSGEKTISGFAIPRLKCRVPDQVSNAIYLPSNPLSLLDFMFLCGPHLEFTDEEFKEWAIDLASLTLMAGAFFESLSLTEQLQSGKTGDYYSLIYRLFFREVGWRQDESLLQWSVNQFTDLRKSEVNYSQRLFQAREVLKDELLSIGSDLSVAETIFERIDDRNKMWRSAFDESEVISKEDLLNSDVILSSASPGRYRYEFTHDSGGEKVVLCHDIEMKVSAPLPMRADLYKGYLGSYSWGYMGSGPTFLTVSLLAHHLGHVDFGNNEIHKLLERCISLLPEHKSMGPYILTTNLIDHYLND